MLSTLRCQRMPFFLLGGANSFSISTAEQQTEYYNRFRNNYTNHLSNFKSKLQKLEEENQGALNKPQTKAYTHPFHNEHTPLVFSTVKSSEHFFEFTGPEQVSAHYENFMVARKFTLSFWAGAITLSYLSSITDLQWILTSTILPWVYWFYVMWFMVEGRKSFFKPFLSRWYRRVAANDVRNFEVYYHETVETRVRGLMKKARDQMEYSYIHGGYQGVKAEVVNNFLIQEYANLQKHINDRALNVLRSTQQYEDMNRDAIFQDILARTLADLDQAMDGKQGQEIRKKILDSAIEGLAQGRMEYKNDPILPLVEQSLRSNIGSIAFRSIQEQAQMVSLTAEQLKAIKDADQTAKDHYLHAEPSIDASIKSMESVKQILQGWGK